MKTVAISGGFDPVHPGHVRLMREASQYGNVLVILNSDEWLMRKKGYVFQRWHDRAEVIGSIQYVSAVVPVDDLDGTVCAALRALRPAYFANGGDRKLGNTPEVAVCDALGIQTLWSVGGEKYASSSDLVRVARNGMDSP